MFSKSRLMTVGLSVVAGALVIGYLRKSHADSVKANPSTASTTLAAKLGLV